jgi:hypothetical protein
VPPVVFEPTISAGEQPHTHALDCAATGIGHQYNYDILKSLVTVTIIKKTSQSMMYSQIIAVFSQIHTKHKNTVCGQNVELLNVKLVVRIATTGCTGLKYGRIIPGSQSSGRLSFLQWLVTFLGFRCQTCLVNLMAPKILR